MSTRIQTFLKSYIFYPDSCGLRSEERFQNNVLNHAMESGFWNPVNFFLWNLESWVLESGIQLKESGIPLTIGIQNPSSTDSNWNPAPGIRNPQRRIQNPGLSWIPLKGVKCGFGVRIHRFRVERTG